MEQKTEKWIDPQKEANANKIAITTGQKTLNDIWREDGKDFKTVLDDMKKIEEYANQIGLDLNFPYLKGGGENAK